jgi:hypothetical protein
MEKPWIESYTKLNEIKDANKGKNLLLLELGVGMNTPNIIRFPFEELTRMRKNTNFCRINKEMWHLTLLSKSANAIFIEADIGEILALLI